MKIKLMPSSPDVDLEKIKKGIKGIIKKTENSSLHSLNEEPIAFGLKSLNLLVTWPDEKSPEDLEEELKKIKNVSSVEVTDVRRAVG